MYPAVAVHDETPSPNLKVTNNPLKERLLFTFSTFYRMSSGLTSPQQQYHTVAWPRKNFSLPFSTYHLTRHAKITSKNIRIISKDVGTNNYFANLYYNSYISIFTLVTSRGTEGLIICQVVYIKVGTGQSVFTSPSPKEGHKNMIQMEVSLVLFELGFFKPFLN